MTDKPQRIQLSRRAGWRMPENTVKVTRPTEWGNPWLIEKAKNLKDGTVEYWVGTDAYTWVGMTKAQAAERAADAFRIWAMRPAQEKYRQRARLALRGKNLACWCALPKPGEPDICHAAVLLDIANAPEPSP